MKIIQLRKNTIEGWNELPAGDLFTYIKSYAFSRDNLFNGILSNQGIGNIHYGDLHTTFKSPSIDVSIVQVPIIKDQNFIPHSKDLLKDGDLIMADASEDYEGVGVTVSVHGIKDKRIVGGLHTFVLRDEKGLTTEYFRQYIFINPLVRNKLQKIANGVSVYGISKTAVSKIKLSIPPLSEQNRIVAVLETWDKVIEKLIRKVELKKQVKKGLMQDLLTGKMRLPGFTNEWKRVKLGDICKFKKGKGLPKTNITEEGKYPCIHYGELFIKYKEKIKFILSKTNNHEGMFLSEKNDILMPTSDVTPRGLSTASCIDKSGVVLGGDILVIRSLPGQLNGLFFSYFVTISKKSIIRLVSGTTVFHLYGSDLARLKFFLPSIKEQIAITDLITCFEEELSLLENKLQKIKQQKKYLLNNLITGAIRTPENLQ